MQVNEEKGYTHVNANDGEGDNDRPTTQSKTVLDFPFDLNNLFSMQYSFDQLKMAIEYLARQQGDQQVLINELMDREPGSTIIKETVVNGPSRANSSHGKPGRSGQAAMTQSDTIPQGNADT